MTYSDSKTAISYTVSKNGANGAKGDKGDKGETGAKGDDAIYMNITSSNGNVFKNTAIATTLTAHVYKGATELTGAAITALELSNGIKMVEQLLLQLVKHLLSVQVM